MDKKSFSEEEERLENAKKIIKEYFLLADCGLFNTRNIFGDLMETIYNDGYVTIDICYGYSYFEVFGLNEKEFRELKDYYNDLRRSCSQA